MAEFLTAPGPHDPAQVNFLSPGLSPKEQPMNHTDALRRTVKAAGLADSDRHAALVELAATLAAQMDAAGEEPSTRLAAAYLSALKDVSRAVAGATPSRAGKLAQLRAGEQKRRGGRGE